jgi:hypothetical protein
MKFYYEHENFNEVFNGNNTCATSLLDIYYGHRNPIFEFNDSDNIIWHFNKAGDLNLEDFKKNITFYRNAFSMIKGRFNIKIVFSSFIEGANQYDFLNRIVKLKNEYGLHKNQIIIITPNFYANNFKKDLKIICKPYLMGDLCEGYKKTLVNPLIHNNEEINISTVENYLNTKKDKFFLSYNKNALRPQRTKFILWLIKSHLINDSMISLLIKPTLNANYNSNYSELSDLNNYFDEFMSMGNVILDWDYPKNGVNDLLASTMYTTMSHYGKTLFNIVTETSFDNNNLCLTEKTFKPIANCHPFLIVGDYKINNQLKNLGYSLYDDLIDYSFDSVFDNDERMNMVFTEIKRIHALGSNYIIDWYKNNVEKIKSNRDVFFNYETLDSMILKTIDELKECRTLL